MHLSKLQSTAALLLLATPYATADSRSYYIAPECGPKFSGFDGIVAEAMQMAQTTVTKMTANNDVGMQRAFTMLFKDSNRAHVQSRLSDVAGFVGKKVDNPAEAAVIFACDNDDDWEEINEEDRTHQWKNEKYHMRYVSDSTVMNCQRKGKASALQHTNTGAVKAVANGQDGHEPWMDDGWQYPRAVVTLCNRINDNKSIDRFGTLEKYESKLLSKIPTNNPAVTAQVKIVNAPLTSRTVLHEMFHTRISGDSSDLRDRYDNVDGGEKQYGYQKIIRLSAGDQIKFPDAFAFFGQLSSMTKYRLKDGEKDRLAEAEAAFAKTDKSEESFKKSFQKVGDVEEISPVKKLRRFLAKCRDHLVRRADPECKLVL